VPVIEGFKTRHGIRDLVVVADAGMLSIVIVSSSRRPSPSADPA
jgi:hypothetical protein